MRKAPFLFFVPGIKAFPHPEQFTSRYEFPRGALSLATTLNHAGFPSAVIPLDWFMAGSDDPAEVDRQVAAIVASAMEAYKPAAVGVSALYTMMYPTALRVLELAKQVDPSISAGLGGGHPTYTDRLCMADSRSVDWVMRGEGERAILDLARAVHEKRDLSGVPSVTWRAPDGTVVENPAAEPVDMNTLAPLDYRLLPEDFVRNMNVSIMATRGCAYRCTYCTETRFWGNNVRHKPIDRVIDEIRTLATRYGNSPVGFEDSMFDMRTPYFHELMGRLADLDVNLHPGFYVLTRVDTVTEEGLAAMKRANVNNVLFGVESFSPKVLKVMAKRTSPAQIEAALELSARMRMTIGSFWLFGHPGDSPEEAELTLSKLDECYRRGINHTAELAMFVPYPGTIFFTQPERFGVKIFHYDWSRWGRINTDPVCELEGFTAPQIQAVWQRGIASLRKWQLEKPVTEPVGEYFTTDSRAPNYPGV